MIADILVHNDDTVIGFEGATDAGRAWMAENLERGLDHILWGDHLTAADIAVFAHGAGLVLAIAP